MENKEVLEGRLRDLSNKAYQNEYTTHTDFLSASDLAEIYDIFSRQGVLRESTSYNGVTFCLYGGWEDADRKVMCFLPSYLDPETFVLQENAEPGVVSCIRISPVNERFAEDLNHRDYLGSLMNLGIERDCIGDILTNPGGTVCYVFVLKDMASLICKELVRIRHTSVKCQEVPPAECDIRPAFETVQGSVASERLDAILALVYKLSRAEAQRLVEAGNVFVDGRTAYSGGYDLKPGARVSVRGHGKFKYDGVEGTTRKGRLFAKVQVYK